MNNNFTVLCRSIKYVWIKKGTWFVGGEFASIEGTENYVKEMMNLNHQIIVLDKEGKEVVL